MSTGQGFSRRNLIIKTAGSVGALIGAVPTAQGQDQAPTRQLPPLEEGFKLAAPPLVDNWPRRLGDIAQVDLGKDVPELTDPVLGEAVRERHRIYSYLLMKLIHRFWNGNKNGPVGTYPQRSGQLERGRTDRYGGDINEHPDRAHILWDRYLGHNIACIAVDGLGHIIDFDFNHNSLFRSSAEHAESRLVRRLFSLTDVFDSWRTGPHINKRPHAASLGEVTLYTSLESCAQCSGVMSLAGVKQIIYMQNDFTAYKIGNLMYNLANRIDLKDANGNITGNIPGAPVPIPGSVVGLDEFATLNDANRKFAEDMKAAGIDYKKDRDTRGNPADVDQKILDRAFFVSSDKKVADYDPAITSFLCTDQALKVFKDGGGKLDGMVPRFEDHRFPAQNPLPPEPEQRVLTNKECLDEARQFFEYADIEGYRGSPHKL
jgi:tRNA(Arg) A34 adenosine deaminase TadA